MLNKTSANTRPLRPVEKYACYEQRCQYVLCMIPLVLFHAHECSPSLLTPSPSPGVCGEPCLSSRRSEAVPRRPVPVPDRDSGVGASPRRRRRHASGARLSEPGGLQTTAAAACEWPAGLEGWCGLRSVLVVMVTGVLFERKRRMLTCWGGGRRGV